MTAAESTKPNNGPSASVTIGFIGVGNMGKHMAANLLAAGHRVRVTDRRSEAKNDASLSGVDWFASPAEVARKSDVIIASLPGPAEVLEVVAGPSGVLEGACHGSVFIDMSTSTPDSVKQLQQLAEPRGVTILDAPVAGGVRGARSGSLSIMVGGDHEAFTRVLPVLSVLGETIIHVGPLGSGHVAKLVNNMMTVGNGLIAMEAMVVGAKAGLDVELLLQVVNAATGSSFSLNIFPYVIFKRNFAPTKWALAHATKDLRISCELARSLDVPTPVIDGAYEALHAAELQGAGDLDWTTYIQALEDIAGVQVVPRDQGETRE